MDEKKRKVNGEAVCYRCGGNGMEPGLSGENAAHCCICNGSGKVKQELIDFLNQSGIYQIPISIRKHLEKVIDYLYSDELKHYNEEGGPEDHVFESVDALKDWVSQ